jgi:hypothetical protein
MILTSTSSEKLKFNSLFKDMTTNTNFKTNFWQKAPYLCNATLPNVVSSYTSYDLKNDVDGDFIEAGRGTFEEGRTGFWNT